MPYHHKRVDLPEPNPSGLCMCGCGEQTPIAKQSHAKSGWVKDKPMRYVPGHQVRGPRPYRRKIHDRDKAEICRRYVEGETTYDLAGAFGVSDATIGKVLAERGVERRTNSEAHRSYRVLTDAQEFSACRRYRAGETAKSIGDDLGVSDSTILKLLDRHGIPRNHRTIYESVARHYAAMRSLSNPQEAEACRRYDGGESVPEIAAAMSVGVGAIERALKRGGVQLRPGVAGERTAPQIEADVCHRYLDGETPKTISKWTGVALGTIGFILKRNGIEPRYKIKYTPQQEAEAVRRYLDGEPVHDITATLGIAPAGIYPILKRNGLDATRLPRRLEWEETEAAKVIRSLPAYRRWRLAVLRRDKRACRECGSHSTSANPLHVHHLRSFAEVLAEYRPISVDDANDYAALWDTDNGITLCADCHREAHAKVSHLL